MIIRCSNPTCAAWGEFTGDEVTLPEAMRIISEHWGWSVRRVSTGTIEATCPRCTEDAA